MMGPRAVYIAKNHGIRGNKINWADDEASLRHRTVGTIYCNDTVHCYNCMRLLMMVTRIIDRPVFGVLDQQIIFGSSNNDSHCAAIATVVSVYTYVILV